MTRQHPDPLELRLSGDGRRLDIVWDDGGKSALPADRLRAASRSAGAVRERDVDGAQVDASSVVITGVEAVGGYAVRLVFSDGHDRGIYPWRYLHELAAA